MSTSPPSLSKICDLSNSSLHSLYVNYYSSNGSDGADYVDDAVSFAVFSSNHEATCEQHRFERFVSFVVPIVFAVIVVLGIVGNILVLMGVLFGQQMRNTTNILILNLAVADLLFVTICIPPAAVDYAIGWPFGDTMCKVVQYLNYVSTYSSVYTLVLLSLDRYMAVVYPVTSIGMRTVCNATMAIAACWVVVFAACVPVFFVHYVKDLTFDHGEVRSVCTFDRESYNVKAFQSLFFATSLALPLLAILGFYMNMLLRLWRGSAATHGPGPSRDKRNVCKGQENKKRVTKMIVVVIVVFAICWTPLQVVLLLRQLQLYDISTGTGLIVLQIVTHCLAYCNSCLNPILYAFFSPSFRAAFINTCRNTARRRSSSARARTGGFNESIAMQNSCAGGGGPRSVVINSRAAYNDRQMSVATTTLACVESNARLSYPGTKEGQRASSISEEDPNEEASSTDAEQKKHSSCVTAAGGNGFVVTDIRREDDKDAEEKLLDRPLAAAVACNGIGLCAGGSRPGTDNVINTNLERPPAPAAQLLQCK